ncbi:MAG: M28 family peptidase, partial [Armatimonadota bacterium]
MTPCGRPTVLRGLCAAIALGTALCLLTPAMSHSAMSIDELANAISRDRLQSRIEDFAALGSRVSGYPGNEQAAEMILEAFKALGMQTYVQEFDLPTPLEQSASLELGGTTYELHGLWPNLVRTTCVPQAGLQGPVIYVEHGSLSDFNGKEVKGAIVLMNFDTGQNWLNVPLLGASAVIFIEPEATTRGEAEMKWLRVPVDVPRFWLAREDAEAVIAAAGSGQQATLRSRVAWENRVNRNIIGILRGSDPTLRKEAIILEAYYDSVSVVPAIAPGAENAVSIATLLELAEVFAQNPPKRSIIFLACSGHFEALTGAREFANLWGKEPRKTRLRRERYEEMQRQEARLKRALQNTRDELAKMEQRRREFESIKATLSEAQRQRQLELASRINVGQLELSEEAALQRIARLERDIERHKRHMAIWNALDEFDTIHMFIGLDLSTHTPTLGVFQVGWYFAQAHLLRFYSPLGKHFADDAERIARALGVNLDETFVDGINPIKGREWHTFFPGKIAFDHEMIIRGGRPGITFTTVNDARNWVDTPLDTPERVNLDNLVTQNQMLANLLYRFLGDPTLSERALKRVEALKKMDDLVDVEGTVLEFLRRESFVPNSPVPNSLVLVQGQYRIMMGVHTNVLAMANETSEFLVRGEMANTAVRLEAYGFDPDSGDIIYAPDRGTDGDKKYPRAVYGRAGLKRPVIVFPCAAIDLYDLVDERYFQTLEKVFVYDAEDYSEPISFGYSINELKVAAEFPSYVEPCAVIYPPRDLRAQITMSMGLVGIRMVCINATPQKPTGVGFLASETPAIAMTPLQVARDMWLIDDFRMKRLAEHGITNQRVSELHQTAWEALKTAEAALKEKRYDVALATARHAWGYESRAYPDVQRTAEDVVKGVLFYLAILLPFAYFGERLFVHARTIIGQIIWTVVVFVVMFMVLALVHPAFALTTSPPIILLAFIVMALAVLVISIVTMKFNQELKSMKQSRGGVHEADVGRLSVAGAAFGLGIANMRRRKTRTALTAITLILL